MSERDGEGGKIKQAVFDATSWLCTLLFSQSIPVCVLNGLYNLCACKHVCLCVTETDRQGGEIKQGVFDVA